MIIGIDPGLSGAIAVIEGREVLLLEDIPTVTFSEGRTKSRVDACLLADILLEYQGARMAVVEKVSSRPGEGVSSAFSFGFTSGVILGVLGALKIPVVQPSPYVWKKALGLGKDKDMSRARAIALYPAISDKLKLKKHHDRAEAILMARWGQTPF